MAEVARKWRPGMGTVIALVCLTLTAVPVAAFLLLRLSDNQFVRETEQTLINQGALYAARYAEAYRATGAPLPPPMGGDERAFWRSDLHPTEPRLNLRRAEVLPPLPDTGPEVTLTGPYPALAEQLLPLARAARRTTLSGIYFLDNTGQSLSGKAPLSFANEPEVQAALQGRVESRIRARGDSFQRHALTSLSRDTWYRVFTATPVVVDSSVVGVVYLSRTPSNLSKFAASQRYALLTMLAATLLSAALVAWLLTRLFLRPIRTLQTQSHRIATGQSPEPEALKHYGTREFAALGQDVMHMAESLSRRAKEITVYTDHVTHELKSPTTAIIGAAELLSTDLPEASRTKLQDNIRAEGQRMDRLLTSLRDMTRLRNQTGAPPVALKDILPDENLQVTVTTDPTALVPLSPEHGRIALHHLAQNAADHGATALEITFTGPTLDVKDNGPGIAPEHIAKVTEPFFTTRRATGGTGMGLAIVQTILETYGARLEILPSDTGAHIRLHFPTGVQR